MTGGGPARLVLVAGTGTEIGKTWVTAALSRELARGGQRVAARKPAQSFDPDDAAPTDAAVLADATGDDPDSVCPPHRCYPIPLAPPMAAEALGLRPPTIADLVAELQWPPDIDVGFVETAGGVGSPQAVDGDVVELVGALHPTVVVLVADAGLGTINAVRLSCRALQRADTPVIVHLNRFDPDEDLHRRNLAWLDTHDAHRAVTTIGDLAAALLRPPSGIR